MILLKLLIYRGKKIMSNNKYQFNNNVCPVCDKVVDSYNYKIIDGKKYHIGCTGMIKV